MHERCGLKGMIAAFALQVTTRHPPQLFVNERHQLRDRLFVVASLPVQQQLSDILR
jgi:hypothetical protein